MASSYHTDRCIFCVGTVIAYSNAYSVKVTEFMFNEILIYETVKNYLFNFINGTNV
jgi:hypothetical protein